MDIEVGKTYWLVTRERVRAGKGPRQVTVTELVYTTSAGVRSVTAAWCGKTLVGASELFADEKAARKQVLLVCDIEWANERDRHHKVVERLRSAWLRSKGT